MNRKKIIQLLIYGLFIPSLIIIGFFVLKDRQYNLISISIILAMFIPFFYSFEKKESSSRELVLLAVMVAMAVVARVAFFFLPAVNPMPAIIILTGIYLGPDMGFMTGALGPLISNMIFTQGPWTPFQMFSYGIFGLIAGLPFVANKAKDSRILLSILGISVGIFYSLLMDVWTVLSMDRVFSWYRYSIVIVQAIPYTIGYLFANATFLNILNRPIGQRIERIKRKYGIDVGKSDDKNRYEMERKS